ncbi:hypothetical protein EPI10_018693 [Gossypium australe]|uniref:Uncharacterized protein n=1 Tax=Gossypium australe TaxID=47621 RepID=A0A5B6UFY1_9ROSI|nr:hypothetical protein EPI10_018693 [Gossypium australe]
MCYPFLFFFHKVILNLGAFSIFPLDSNEGSAVPLLPSAFPLPFLELLLQFCGLKHSRIVPKDMGYILFPRSTTRTYNIIDYSFRSQID